MTVQIIRGDARHLALADDSVDLVVTSPPYFGLRSYQDGGQHYDGQVGAEATPAEFLDALTEFLDALTEVTRECVRVLKLSADYCRLASAPELIDARTRKVLGVDKGPAQVVGQGDLFGDDAA